MSNPILIDQDKNYEAGMFNRKLYKYQKIDWDNKKNYNFLTNVGGLETGRNNIYLNFRENSALNSTNNTYNMFSSRPDSGIMQSDRDTNRVRPYTGFPTIKNNKLESNQTSERQSNRPITAM